MKRGYKQTAIDFLNMIIAGNIDEAYKKYTARKLEHHNPYFPADAVSLQKGMEENHQEFPNKIFEIKHVIVEEDMVTVHSHLRMNTKDKGMATIHILRFQNGKIIEMWDVAQPVPEEVVNENGMF